MSGPVILTSFGMHVVTLPEIDFSRRIRLEPSEVVFANGSSIRFVEDPAITAKHKAQREAEAAAKRDAERRHREARGPGTRKRTTKIDRYPFKVDAPVVWDSDSDKVPPKFTRWCRDNAVGKYRLDNENKWSRGGISIGVTGGTISSASDPTETRRFHFSNEQDALMFQMFSGATAANNSKE